MKFKKCFQTNLPKTLYKNKLLNGLISRRLINLAFLHGKDVVT